jgi:site-specific recombinase XerC
VTREFLKQTARAGVAEATRARTYASVRHFARWIHFKVQPFPLGCPTDGIKPPHEPEPQWKGLSRADELRLLAAAQTLHRRRFHSAMGYLSPQSSRVVTPDLQLNQRLIAVRHKSPTPGRPKINA